MRSFAVLALVSVATAKVVTIQVGGTTTTAGGPLQFIPSSVTASNGDTISFSFSGSPGNHTVSQSAFANPCQPLSGGFDSGFIFIPPGSSAANAPTWNLTITDDTKPLWFYCKQLQPTPHCRSGMVGAVNPPTSGNTFSAFQTAAMASTGTPGQSEGGLAGVGASASAPPGPLTGSISGYSVPTATSPGSASGATPASTASPSGSPSPAATKSSASSLTANAFVVLLAAMFGITLA